MSSTSDRPTELEGSVALQLSPVERARRRTRRLWLSFGESASLAIALGLYNGILAPENPGLVTVSPHPTLLIALLILVRYGFVSGLMATLLLTVEHAIMLLVLADAP